MTWKYDSEWNEPRPQKHKSIFCFDCKKTLANRRAATDHKGHRVEYLDEKGEVMV